VRGQAELFFAARDAAAGIKRPRSSLAPAWQHHHAPRAADNGSPGEATERGVQAGRLAMPGGPQAEGDGSNGIPST